MIVFRCYIKRDRLIQPVNRQTLTTAKQQPCKKKQNIRFQINIENDNSW